jgi:hypothetical protein
LKLLFIASNCRVASYEFCLNFVEEDSRSPSECEAEDSNPATKLTEQQNLQPEVLYHSNHSDADSDIETSQEPPEQQTEAVTAKTDGKIGELIFRWYGCL